MKIGDKIRFLDDVGGGTVKGFARGGYAVIVDDDGFEQELRTKYPQCYWQDAPFHKYGYGATKVTIR